MSNNPHTGDRLVSKPTTKEYEENFDRIFRQEKKGCGCPVWVAGCCTIESKPKEDCCVVHEQGD